MQQTVAQARTNVDRRHDDITQAPKHKQNLGELYGQFLATVVNAYKVAVKAEELAVVAQQQAQTALDQALLIQNRDQQFNAAKTLHDPRLPKIPKIPINRGQASLPKGTKLPQGDIIDVTYTESCQISLPVIRFLIEQRHCFSEAGMIFQVDLLML